MLMATWCALWSPMVTQGYSQSGFIWSWSSIACLTTANQSKAKVMVSACHVDVSCNDHHLCYGFILCALTMNVSRLRH